MISFERANIGIGTSDWPGQDLILATSRKYAKIPDLSTGGSGVTLGPDYYISVLVVQEPSLASSPNFSACMLIVVPHAIVQ